MRTAYNVYLLQKRMINCFVLAKNFYKILFYIVPCLREFLFILQIQETFSFAIRSLGIVPNCVLLKQQALVAIQILKPIGIACYHWLTPNQSAEWLYICTVHILDEN